MVKLPHTILKSIFKVLFFEILKASKRDSVGHREISLPYIQSYLRLGLVSHEWRSLVSQYVTFDNLTFTVYNQSYIDKVLNYHKNDIKLGIRFTANISQYQTLNKYPHLKPYVIEANLDEHLPHLTNLSALTIDNEMFDETFNIPNLKKITFFRHMDSISFSILSLVNTIVKDNSLTLTISRVSNITEIPAVPLQSLKKLIIFRCGFKLEQQNTPTILQTINSHYLTLKTLKIVDCDINCSLQHIFVTLAPNQTLESLEVSMLRSLLPLSVITNFLNQNNKLRKLKLQMTLIDHSEFIITNNTLENIQCPIQLFSHWRSKSSIKVNTSPVDNPSMFNGITLYHFSTIQYLNVNSLDSNIFKLIGLNPPSLEHITFQFLFTSLEIYDNSTSTEMELKNFTNALTNNCNLTSLRFSSTLVPLSLVTSLLQLNHKYIKLLSFNNITEWNSEELPKYFGMNRYLHSLSINSIIPNSSISINPFVICISKILDTNDSLNFINISNSRVSPNNVTELVQNQFENSLKRNTSIKSLTLGITSGGISEIIQRNSISTYSPHYMV
ncbi:hypothetical protein DLAC_02191 [Tieghemostelium lacteum]|uniref:F-box domain-containing protein n=1 Tax=Tieghemostelium lacteum TaxID=361077 RepID=A0A152A4C3_TIELA|nr:hypothetical protein DLAC_02191 [Tieghemostelium lacteum]|eukprot:KYR01093.1 hypothetical protein DLAC_02191 [Tieghemostelium lacteum]